MVSPCPFCGSDKLTPATATTPYIICNNCGCQGPVSICGTTKDCNAMWSNRDNWDRKSMKSLSLTKHLCWWVDFMFYIFYCTKN